MDFSPLEKIYTADGPFVSAYLDTHEDAEDGAARRETAWKNAARTLIDDGADGATVDAMTQAVLGPRPQGGARVLIASHGHVHLATWLPERRGGADLALVAELPRLLPLIEARADRIPHVVVLTDRLGADVLAFTEGDRPIDIKSTGDVAPWPVHKTGTGGWAAKRFDATVEEDWHRGAEQIAALVEKVSRDTQARLVIASGDERAITLLRQHLPHDLADSLAVVPGGGRRADGGDDVLARHVEEVVLEFAAREHSEI